MSRYIIGLNVSNHDSSAALLKDGELVCFAEQERFSRKKMALGEAPIDALKFCLEKECITLNEVEAIAIGMDWNYRKEKYGEPKEERNKYLRFDDQNWFLPKEVFGEHIPKIYPIRHHLAHASSAYRVSGFENAAVLVVDNRGEDASTSLGTAVDGKICFFKQLSIQNSLGVFYNQACRYTGLYGMYREVGKFMGLAAYGIPNVKMPLKPSRDGSLFFELPSIDNKSIYESLQIRKNQLMEYFRRTAFPYEEGNVEEIMGYANFAASVQKVLEDILLDFVKELKEKTGLDNLVIAGGVALNCSANGKIEKSGIFKNIFIPPFASDSGTAVGAALELSYSLSGKKYVNKPLKYANLGLAYNDEQIVKVLNSYNQNVYWKKLDDEDLFDKVSLEIINGEIIAWMQGSFEAGPRALGYRSILADPRTRKSLIKLNNIKQREMWRPIAPSVLESEYSNYFEGPSQNKYFMNVATKVKEDCRKKVPAIVHVDGSARPQIVTNKNEKYYGLIKVFFQKTGVPMLCNTSFNLKGIPLVNSPKDAIECLLCCNITTLVIGNYLVSKQRF